MGREEHYSVDDMFFVFFLFTHCLEWGLRTLVSGTSLAEWVVFGEWY